MKKPILTPVNLGVALGYGIAGYFLKGGYDAFRFYLRSPTLEATAPAWVYLVTYPLGILRWPFGWQILIVGTVLTAGVASNLWKDSRWWVVTFSGPLLWTIWLGQIEIFPILGVILCTLVMKQKLHPAWLGVGWLALITKPQVGLGLLLVYTWWIWREMGIKAILWAGFSALAILAPTFLIWPEWVQNWSIAVRELNPTWWNATIWPYGLFALPLALLPIQMSRQRRLRMVSAASLLASPYFALYHCSTLLTFSSKPYDLLFSWLPVVIGLLFFEQWAGLGWILPAMILATDLFDLYRIRIKKIDKQ